jgi:hypothetical protein
LRLAKTSILSLKGLSRIIFNDRFTVQVMKTSPAAPVYPYLDALGTDIQFPIEVNCKQAQLDQAFLSNRPLVRYYRIAEEIPQTGTRSYLTVLSLPFLPTL